jgi:pimeloyl-ACP methyl ester carboxylesterase
VTRSLRQEGGVAARQWNRPEAGDPVVLVHGLWMTGWEMRFLGWRLARAGYRPCCFRYRSWRGALDEAVRALRKFIEAVEGERVHLVGHSLGGIVIARALEERPLGRRGRVAMLGTPMAGSGVAAKMVRSGTGRWIMGAAAREGIVERPPQWRGDRELLVVAGDLPIGTGLLLGLATPHDGLIRLGETRVRGARAERVRTTHLGLLLSRKVAAMLSDFFAARDGAAG